MVKGELWHEIHIRHKLKETKKIHCLGRWAEHPDGAEDPPPGLAANLYEEAPGGRAFGTVQGVYPSEGGGGRLLDAPRRYSRS